MDCFDAMTDTEWNVLVVLGRKACMQAEMTKEEKKAAESLVKAGWVVKEKVQGFWWFMVKE